MQDTKKKKKKKKKKKRIRLKRKQTRKGEETRTKRRESFSSLEWKRLFPEVSVAISIARLVFPLERRGVPPSP